MGAPRRWQSQRAALPVAAIRAPLLEALQQADVAVVSGNTGCGKTTQARMLQYACSHDHGKSELAWLADNWLLTLWPGRCCAKTSSVKHPQPRQQ